MGQFQSTNFSFSGERAKKYQLIGPTLWLLFIKEKETGASSENRDRLNEENHVEEEKYPGTGWCARINQSRH